MVFLQAKEAKVHVQLSRGNVIKNIFIRELGGLSMSIMISFTWYLKPQPIVYRVLIIV